MAKAGAESTSQDALIERATQLIGDTLYPDHFGVLLLDEAAQVLRFHSSYRGLNDKIKRMAVPLGRGIGILSECPVGLIGDDVAAVLTFVELRNMFAEAGIQPDKVEPSEFDPPWTGSGGLFPISRGLLQFGAERQIRMVRSFEELQREALGQGPAQRGTRLVPERMLKTCSIYCG